MNLRVTYDEEVDVLCILTGERRGISATMPSPGPYIVVDLSKEGGYHVVGVEVIGASTYLPLGKCGYDAESDTLVMGTVVDDPDLVTRNGDITTYWQPDEYDPNYYFMEPVCVAITEASKHLSVKNIQRLGHESETELARTLVE